MRRKRIFLGSAAGALALCAVAVALSISLAGAHSTPEQATHAAHAGASRTSPAHAAAGSSKPGLLVTVGTPIGSGAVVKPGFVGLSLEESGILPYTGSDPRAINPVLVQLIRNLAPGQRPVLRLGGDSTDWTWWPVSDIAKPGGVRYALTPQWLAVTGALTKELDARVIAGIDLEADNTALANAEANAILSGLGRQTVEAFELGNEPELYSSFTWYVARNGTKVPGRPAGYTETDYTNDFARFSRALPAGVPLAGPATGGKAWLPDLAPFIDLAPRLGLVTVHRYPLQLCFVPPNESIYPTIGNLLASASSTGLAATVVPALELADARGVPLRVDEMNTISCGLEHVVGKSFASGLWVLDSLFAMARVGVDGVNIHTFPGSGSELFSFTEKDGHWRGQVEPEYYGMLMFAQAAPAGSQLLHIGASADSSLQQWATKAPDGQIRVLLINEALSRPALVSVRMPAGAGDASVSLLRAPSIVAQSGVTLGGQSFGSATSTGLLAGKQRLQTLAPRSGLYVVRLPPATAALLTFGSARQTTP